MEREVIGYGATEGAEMDEKERRGKRTRGVI
jgi:hypothetical protein